MERTCDNCGNYKSARCSVCITGYDEKADTLISDPSEWIPAAKDNVNHPSHYETGKFECIDVMIETQGVEAVKNFCLCNAFKYIYRHKKKNGVEDVKKAIWYLNKFVELENMNQNE